MNNTEKKITAFLSASLPSGHSYDRLEDAERKLLQKSKPKWKIGLAVAIPSAAIIGVVAVTVSLGVFLAEPPKPFETGRLKDFSSIKGFGIRAKDTENVAKTAFLNPKRLVSSSTMTGTPVKFYQYNLQGNYEEAIVFNEGDTQVRDYHVAEYYETHDFVTAFLCSEAVGKKYTYSPYYSSYTYSNESNSIALWTGPNPWREERGGKLYPYLISKRTGKIYNGDIPDKTYGAYRLSGDLAGSSSEKNPYDLNFYGYEDGCVFFAAEEGWMDNSAMFLVKEEEGGLKFQRMLAGTQYQALKKLGSGASGFFVDRYGNPFHESAGAVIGGRVVENTCLDPYNNTIYQVEFEDGHARFSYLNKNGEFILDPKKEGSFIFGGVSLPTDKEIDNIFDLGRVYYRGEDYIITDSPSGSSYKLTFLAKGGGVDYRDYMIEPLPVDLDIDWGDVNHGGNVIAQGDTLYTLDSSQQQIFQIDCKTLAYEAFDIGDDDWKIDEFGLEPNGDIWVKGYSKDLKEVVGYIVDGQFTYEKRGEDADGYVYYVRPLN